MEKIDFPPNMSPARVADIASALLKAHDSRGTTLVAQMAIKASGGDKAAIAILLAMFHKLHEGIRATVERKSGLKIPPRPPPHLAISVAKAKLAERARVAQMSGYYFEMGWGFDDLVKVITAPARAVIHLVTHPLDALHDIANAVAHPLDTLGSAIEAIGRAISDTAKMALQAAAMALQVPLVRHLLAGLAQGLNLVLPGLGVAVGIAIESAGEVVGEGFAQVAEKLPGGGIADVINNIRLIPGADGLMQVAAQTLGSPGLGKMVTALPPTVHDDGSSTPVAQPLAPPPVVVAPMRPAGGDPARDQAKTMTALALSVVQTRATAQSMPAPAVAPEPVMSLDDVQKAAAQAVNSALPAATPSGAPDDGYWANLQNGQSAMGGLIIDLLMHMPSVIASVIAQNWANTWYQKHLVRKATKAKALSTNTTGIVQGWR